MGRLADTLGLQENSQLRSAGPWWSQVPSVQQLLLDSTIAAWICLNLLNKDTKHFSHTTFSPGLLSQTCCRDLAPKKVTSFPWQILSARVWSIISWSLLYLHHDLGLHCFHRFHGFHCLHRLGGSRMFQRHSDHSAASQANLWLPWRLCCNMLQHQTILRRDLSQWPLPLRPTQSGTGFLGQKANTAATAHPNLQHVLP